MSRSVKKYAVGGIALARAKEHSKAKKSMVSRTRNWLNIQEEIANGSFYKKFLHDYAWRPDDGRKITNDPKDYRK